MNLHEMKRQSNKGFTLLEVLLAVVLLSIVVVPFLHVFVSASTVNMKARQIMRATTVAQNAMEELKATNVGNFTRSIYGVSLDEKGEALSTGLNGMQYDAEGAFEAEQVSDTSESGTVVSYRTASVPSLLVKYDSEEVDKAVASEFRGQAAVDGVSNYYYVIPDATIETSEYDLLVHLKSIKSVDNAQIISMNDSNCAYYAEASEDNSSRLAMQAADTFAMRHMNYSDEIMTASDFLSVMSKTVTIDIARDGETGLTTVNLEYDFDCGSGYTEETDRHYSERTSIFNDYTDEKGLSAIYLYYYPLYNLGGTGRDKIVINNPDGTDVDVYLICMQGSDFSALNEMQYRASVYVNGGETEDTRILSNRSDEMVWNRFKDGFSATYPIEPLGNTVDESVLYSVEISVYKHDESALGAASGKRTFAPNEDKFVTTYTGTLLDNSVYSK